MNVKSMRVCLVVRTLPKNYANARTSCAWMKCRVMTSNGFRDTVCFLSLSHSNSWHLLSFAFCVIAKNAMTKYARTNIWMYLFVQINSAVFGWLDRQHTFYMHSPSVSDYIWLCAQYFSIFVGQWIINILVAHIQCYAQHSHIPLIWV